MGFWPYLRQAHESDGGVLVTLEVSPLSRDDPSTSFIGIDTTLFCTDLRLLLKHVTLITINYNNPFKLYMHEDHAIVYIYWYERLIYHD